MSAGVGCPACGAQLEALEVSARRFHRCRHCEGAWVEETVLADMLAAMRPGGKRPAGLPYTNAPSPAGPPRPCPRCRDAMTHLGLAGVIVDRCPNDHGVWFDREELEAALQRAAAQRGETGGGRRSRGTKGGGSTFVDVFQIILEVFTW